MKRIFRVGFLMLVFSIVFTSKTKAADYQINSFLSEIKLEQDSGLVVSEKIEVNYFVEKHGFYRVIPYIYNKNGKTVRSKLEVVGVTNEWGQAIPFTVEKYNRSKKIKIGDPNWMVSGLKKYVLTYKVRGVMLDYGEGPEIYWNVTGDEWEVPIEKASALVSSPFGKITKAECFGCALGYSEKEANFDGEQGLTVVVQIDKNNSIKMPGFFERNVGLFLDVLTYMVALIPLIVMFIFWYKKGRDKRYLSGNIYYQPENKTETDVSLFSRPHLPLVYAPIDGLSPAEVGTIIDERVDTKDIVAEIVELARLGNLKIKKIETTVLLGIKGTDYELTKTKKVTEELNKFQKNLLDKLFESGGVVKISDLKNNFYKHLGGLKSDLYNQLAEKGLTDKGIEKVITKWVLLSILINLLGFAVVTLIIFLTKGSNGPKVLTIVSVIPIIFLAIKMPRKTAKGYGFYRQAIGLKYYLGKGKWREEIAEKNLFLEEMLPLAISLGVVNKLAEDMKELELKPPKYFTGMTINSFGADLRDFNSAAVSGLISSPSGSGSWSGGSGFSGGGGGGGFGGGGGGSW